MGASKQAVAEGNGNELPPLTNERAQEHLDKYHDGMRQVHGEDVEWVRAPFDAQVMYDSTGRKPHGKFAIADGAVDSSEVQFSTNAHPSQSQSSIQRERDLIQQIRDVKRQRQEDRNLFCDALKKFNEDMFQYMRQGCTNAPPPQINLASLFPNPVQTPSESDNIGNSSVNGTLPQMGGSPSCQQPTTNNYQQDNIVDVGSQRMNGTSFNHATGQTFQNIYRQESMQNYSRVVPMERMGRSAIGNEGTPTNNYRNTQMRDGDEIEDNIFFS